MQLTRYAALERRISNLQLGCEMVEARSEEDSWPVDVTHEILSALASRLNNLRTLLQKLKETGHEKQGG